MAVDLSPVRRATAKRSAYELAWKHAIRKAVAEGASLRDVGKAAGVTHTRIFQIVRET